MQITIKAPCKINLALDVIGKLENGYHEVKMVMQALNLYDVITISKTQNRKITVCSNFPFDISTEKNTAYIAAKLMFECSNIKDEGVHINLQKKIPVLAGLAGGSTDAAAVLIGINNLFNLNFSNDNLSQIGAKIGADVPFCIYGGTRLCKGTGTKTVPVKNLPNCYIILAKPNVSVSTKKAYAQFDKMKLKDSFKTDELIKALENKDICKISAKVFNRFEDVTNIADIKNIKNIMQTNKSLCACMSGSGPTVFGIFINESDASICFNKLKKLYSNVFICKPVRHGCIAENIVK